MEYLGKVFTPTNPIYTSPVGWYVAKPEIVTIDGVDYVGWDSGTVFRLPTEFFNHQLMELDPDDMDALMRFMSEYGIPRYPWRGTGYRPSKDSPWLLPNDPEFEVERALDLSDSQWSYGIPSYVFTEDETVPDGFIDLMDICGLTSLDEVRFTVCHIKTCIETLFSYMKDEIDLAVMGWMNESRFPRLIQDGLSMPREAISIDGKPVIRKDMMTAAICHQVFDFISSDLQYRECDCGKIFKRFQPRSGYASEKAPSRSRFCCERCRDKYNKAEYRKNRKNSTSKAD